MFEQLRQKLSLDNEIWEEWARRFTKMKYPAKTALLKEGEISNKVFCIEKGCVRAWFNHDGNDLTFQFFMENSIVASIESFRKNTPSPIAIETIEPTIIWCAHKKDINELLQLIKTTPPLLDTFIDASFERTFVYMKHFLSFIKDTPQQRYLQLLVEKPEIIQRIPQHYIASYLGISRVHLSRIKNKLVKNGTSKI